MAEKSCDNDPLQWTAPLLAFIRLHEWNETSFFKDQNPPEMCFVNVVVDVVAVAVVVFFPWLLEVE